MGSSWSNTPYKLLVLINVIFLFKQQQIIGVESIDDDLSSYYKTYSKAGTKECFSENKIYYPKRTHTEMRRDWSFKIDTYMDDSLQQHCNNLQALLDSSEKGERKLSTAKNSSSSPVFHPYGCAYRWYNNFEICSILSNFSSINFYGDSIVRHSCQVMTMLATDDFILGAIPRGSSELVYKTCRCDGQLSEAQDCRRFSNSMFQMRNSSLYGFADGHTPDVKVAIGMCANHRPFEFSLNDNQEAQVGGASTSIDNKCPAPDDRRPRVVITNFGLHLEPR